MASGFALGGFASAFQQGMRDNSMAEYRTEELRLQQQGQQNQQQRDQYARIDKLRAETWSVISETVTHAQNAGQEPLKIAQVVQGPLQMLKRLAKSSGIPDADGLYDAQLATLLARPSPFDVMNGRTGAPARSAAAPGTGGGNARGAIMPPPVGTSNDLYEARPQSPGNSSPASSARGQAAAPQPAVDDVDRLTRAMAIADDPGLRQAFAVRLQDALRRRGDDTEVKTLKDENGNEHMLFVSPKNRTVTDTNGNPYVTPSAGGDDSDTHRIATAIKEGRQPPVTSGLYKNAKGVRADLERQGVNLSELQLEWDSAKKQIASLNGPQMVRYAGLTKSVDATINEVRDLSKQMDLSGVPLANKVAITAYIQTAGNTQTGQLAARYIAAVNTLKEEFTSLAQGGYAPTEAAWALSNQQINQNFGVKELDASLTEIQRLIRYRLQGIPNFQQLGPGSTNRYVPGSVARHKAKRLHPGNPGHPGRSSGALRNNAHAQHRRRWPRHCFRRFRENAD